MTCSTLSCILPADDTRDHCQLSWPLARMAAASTCSPQCMAVPVDNRQTADFVLQHDFGCLAHSHLRPNSQRWRCHVVRHRCAQGALSTAHTDYVLQHMCHSTGQTESTRCASATALGCPRGCQPTASCTCNCCWLQVCMHPPAFS